MGISQSVTEKMEEETRLTKLSVNAFVLAKSLGCMYSSFYGHKCLFFSFFAIQFNYNAVLGNNIFDYNQQANDRWLADI